MNASIPTTLRPAEPSMLLPLIVETRTVSLMVTDARTAAGNKMFAQALSLWQDVETHHGRSRDTLCGIGRAFREMGDAENADLVLSEAVQRFPNDPELAAEYALVAEVREDWLDAAARWHVHLARFPDLRLFCGMAALAAARAGQHDKAESILQEALSEQPTSLGLRVDHAIAAQYAELWDEAVRRWDLVLELKPDTPAYIELRGNACWHASLQISSAAENAIMEAQPDGDDFLTIVTTFESLGDNCEFGLLQRKLGLEPVSLFRFSAVKPDKMVALLDLRFSPLGDPEHMVIECDGDEYIVADDRGYFWMHSFVRKGQMDEKKYFKQQIARITLLKRKMIFHLEAGDKIYICKNSHERVSDEMLYRVSQSLCSFGKNLLLGVRLADDDNPPGSVIRLNDGVLVGHLQTMSSSLAKIDTKNWERILRQAYGYRRELASVPTL